jgi:phosphatidylinositol 4-kinase A
MISQDHSARLKELNLALRLLVENEILRLTVWSNPANDPKRGLDSFSTTERAMHDVRTVSYMYDNHTHISSDQLD